MASDRRRSHLFDAVGLCAGLLCAASLAVAAEPAAPVQAPSAIMELPGRIWNTPPKAAGDAGIAWVRIPGGTFAMGNSFPSEQAPRHEVAVETFLMAKTLVTNKQYRACVAAGACSALDEADGMKGDQQPAVGVTWDQAKAFSEWAGGRLPTEAEWEYAARSGGLNRAYPWGDEAASCATAVLDAGGKQGCDRATTWPVCSKPLGNTKQGLCDMAGNANEWVQDSYHDSYRNAPSDGSAWEDPAESRHVYRGGAWCSTPEAVGATVRMGRASGDAYRGLGFRPVRDAGR